MTARLQATVAALAVAVAVLGGCGSGDDPYDALSAEAQRYVIPESEGLTSGELCPDGGDCSGPITVGAIQDYEWLRVTGISVPREQGDRASVPATLEVTERARSDDRPADEVLDVQMWGPDVDKVRTALSSDFEVWAGMDAESDYVVVFAAFDAEGRLAGIGNAAADYFTIPVAELAADAGARSGMDFVRPLMAD